MKILIARHGQDQDNFNNILNGHRNMPLTALGKEQAKVAANKLLDDNIGVDVILSSPLKRAFGTAEIISKTINGPKPIIEPLLIERDFGILTGRPLSEIPKYAGKTLQTDVVNYFLEAENSETFPELYRRANLVLKKVSTEYPNKTVLLVTHGDTGKMVRAAFHKWTWKKGLMTKYFDNSEILFLEERNDRIE